MIKDNFAGQIYEMKLFEVDNAIKQYMRIINEYPNSVYSEPIRYHIRNIQNKEVNENINLISFTHSAIAKKLSSRWIKHKMTI